VRNKQRAAMKTQIITPRNTRTTMQHATNIICSMQHASPSVHNRRRASPTIVQHGLLVSHSALPVRT
jgi:hypothetical protein